MNKWLSPEDAVQLLPLVDEKRPNERLAELVKEMLHKAGTEVSDRGKTLSARAAYRMSGVDNNTIMNMSLGVPPPRMDTASRFARGLNFSEEEAARLIVYAYGTRLYPDTLENVMSQAVRLSEDLDEEDRRELMEVVTKWKQEKGK